MNGLTLTIHPPRRPYFCARIRSRPPHLVAVAVDGVIRVVVLELGQGLLEGISLFLALRRHTDILKLPLHSHPDLVSTLRRLASILKSLLFGQVFYPGKLLWRLLGDVLALFLYGWFLFLLR